MKISKSHRIMNIIKKVDLYGTTVNLQVNSGDNYKTFFGAVITVLYLLLLSAYAVAQFT